MSNQFYGDSQVMVKNTYFYLAKQILMNPSLPVLLMLSGDDRLENIFDRVRMQGLITVVLTLKRYLNGWPMQWIYTESSVSTQNGTKAV
jgi:hypothetical protein